MRGAAGFPPPSLWFCPARSADFASLAANLSRAKVNSRPITHLPQVAVNPLRRLETRFEAGEPLREKIDKKPNLGSYIPIGRIKSINCDRGTPPIWQYRLQSSRPQLRLNKKLWQRSNAKPFGRGLGDNFAIIGAKPCRNYDRVFLAVR